MKKLLLFLLTVLLPIVASANVVEIDGIYFNLIPKGGIAEVTNMPNGHYSGCLVIPEKVSYGGTDYNVLSIGNEAFLGCAGLTSITIPSSVTSIGNNAFAHCTGLTSVDIPNNVTSISYDAFSGCTGLTSIIIPNSVTSIGSGTFQNCTGLISVSVGNNLKSIDERTFQNCSALASITIPNNVTSIGKEAFMGCRGLTSVTIPNCVTSIETRTFAQCSVLVSITIPNSVTSIGQSAFEYCTSLTSVIIPNSVTSIGQNAFGECHGLTSVTLPSSLKSIENGVFYGCSSLTSITIPNSVITIGGNAFWDCKSLTSVTIPNSVISIGQSAFEYCTSLSSVTIGSSVENILDNAFGLCRELENVYCLAKKIPISSSNIFQESYIEFATLYVLPSLVEAYKASIPWNSFKSIVMIDMPIYKLTYIVDGEEYKTYEIEEGTPITQETAPEKKGYTFSGWSEIPETMPAHDVTVTGTFNINKYKLTYMIDDKVYKDTMYEYGAAITPEPQPEGDYATFEWIDLPQTMPAHDVVVYANYTSGIIEVLMTTQRNIHIYSPNGKKLDKLQKGLNIVVLDDGTVKKAVVK